MEKKLEATTLCRVPGFGFGSLLVIPSIDLLTESPSPSEHIALSLVELSLDSLPKQSQAAQQKCNPCQVHTQGSSRSRPASARPPMKDRDRWGAG